MEVTYYGHSCFLIEMGDYKVLFDPFITPNELAKEIDIEKIEADYILISHAHQDHTADVEAIARRTGATIVSNWEITQYYAGKGIEKVHPMNIGGKWSFEFGIVKVVSAVHSSSFPDGTYGGNPQGFLIESGDKTFYYSGDTALHTDMKLVGQLYNKIDFAFMCIGDNFTMDIADAVIAANWINTGKIIGMHYNTFPYIEIDPVETDLMARNNDKELILLQIGQTINL